jgi:hypothetical protein
VTDNEYEQRIDNLRRLAAAQQTSIARRQEMGEAVPTADINGLAQLTTRLDAMERVLEHRRSRAKGRRQTKRGANRTSS